MKTQTSKSEALKSVNKYAWNLVKKAEKSWKEALKAAWDYVKNQAKAILATSSQFFEITFVKISTGEITTRQASNAKIKEGNLLFFSITDNGFRQAVIEKIIDVNPINATLSLI